MDQQQKELDEAEAAQLKMEQSERTAHIQKLEEDRNQLARELDKLQEEINKQQRAPKKAPIAMEFDTGGPAVSQPHQTSKPVQAPKVTHTSFQARPARKKKDLNYFQVKSNEK
jgi:hypothetical protein